MSGSVMYLMLYVLVFFFKFDRSFSWVDLSAHNSFSPYGGVFSMLS